MLKTEKLPEKNPLLLKLVLILLTHFYPVTNRNLTLIHISELHVLFSAKDQVHSYI